MGAVEPCVLKGALLSAVLTVSKSQLHKIGTPRNSSTRTINSTAKISSRLIRTSSSRIPTSMADLGKMNKRTDTLVSQYKSLKNEHSQLKASVQANKPTDNRPNTWKRNNQNGKGQNNRQNKDKKQKTDED